MAVAVAAVAVLVSVALAGGLLANWMQDDVTQVLPEQFTPENERAPDEEEPDEDPVPSEADAEPADAEDDDEQLTPPELAEGFGNAVFRVEAEGCGVASSGSAFAIDEHHLVSNHHVVAVDTNPLLVGHDGRRHQGRVVGWRAQPDVAVIRVDETLPVTLDWAPSEDLREGESLVTLGYPVPDGDFTVTPGNILSFQLSDGRRHAIRSDAALDKGNSGGPALDTSGRVAGVVTEMAANDAGFQLVPLIFTQEALAPTIRALRDAEDPPERPDCAGLGVPNPVPEDWQARPPAPGADGYGDDAYLDSLWDACADGDMRACDDLFQEAPYGSEYERFGDTCGQRNQPAGWCVIVHGDRPDTGGQLPSGLFCRDLDARGYSYAEAVEYWYLEGLPERMDASGNGIPCQTVYPASEVDAYWGITDAAVLPSGLFCRDLHEWGYTYAEAVDYWEREGRPDRMDASRNGVPCQTVYPQAEVDAFWNH